MVLTYNVQVVNTSSVIGTTIDTLFVDPYEGTVNITLPAISDNGQRYLIKRVDSTGSSVYILPSGSDTVSSSSTQSISAGQIIELVSLGTNWEYVMNMSL